MAELTTLPGPPTRLGRGTAATQCPPLDAFRVTISAPSVPRFNEPPSIFSACDPGLQCLQWGEISGGTQPLLWFLHFPLELQTVLGSDSEKHNITGRMDQHYMTGSCCPSCPLAGTNVRALRGLTSRLKQTRVYFANCRGILKGARGPCPQWLHDSPQLTI